MRRWVVLFAIMIAVGLGPATTLAHPGRLDAKGCHVVRQDWTSSDGKRMYKAGTRHCHRVSDETRLGEDEIRVEEPAERVEHGRERARKGNR